ncbi:MAG: RidA family protein [Clostridiales bacterium]
MKKVISTKNAPDAIGAYSQGIIVNGFLYASGQIALVPQTGTVEAQNIEGQTNQVMENIGGILKAADLDYSDIVKMTVFLDDIDNFAKFNEIYATYLKEPYPARSVVAVAALPKKVKVEIEMTAALRD